MPQCVVPFELSQKAEVMILASTTYHASVEPVANTLAPLQRISASSESLFINTVLSYLHTVSAWQTLSTRSNYHAPKL